MVWRLLPTPPHAGLVKFLQPHNFRLSALLPPREVARYAAQQQRGQGAAAAADSRTGSKAGSTAQALPAAPERLPYVPEFYSFGSAVKQDPRLLLRHADLALTTAGASEAAGTGYGLAAGWEAVRGAALGSPSCLLRSLAFLFCGSTTMATSCWGPAPALASPSAEETGAAAASAAAVYPAPPAPTSPASARPAGLPTAGASTTVARPAVAAPAQRQHSAEWSLAVGHFLASRSSSSEPASAGGSSPQQRAAAATHALSHAESIAALLPLPASRTNSSSCGDEGHLWAAAAASPSGTAGQQAGDEGHMVGASVPSSGSSAVAAAGGAAATAGPAGPAAVLAAGPTGGSMASAAASVAALAAEIAAAIEQDFDSQSTGEGYWWMWNS